MIRGNERRSYQKIGTAALALAIVVYAAIRLATIWAVCRSPSPIFFAASPRAGAGDPGKRALAVTVLISLLFLFALPAMRRRFLSGISTISCARYRRFLIGSTRCSALSRRGLALHESPIQR